MPQELVCAVDLGSNSFRLMVGRVQGDQIYPLDGLKEPVRLAAGLGVDKVLDEAAQTRGLEALRRFNERLRGFRADGVRAVATNTLRVAKNAPEFLIRAEEALGFPIEVIAGREEARLIYVGVAHTLPDPGLQQLVVDIGGGSTEFIIGRNFEPLHLESLYMGCVSYTMRYFPDGLIGRSAMKEAELAARAQLEAISHAYRETGWDLAVGSSGSAKALCDVLELNGLAHSGITREGLEKLRQLLLKAGHINNLQLEGLKSDRLPVFAGGFAIMSALFKEFDLEHMVFSDGALRLGVLYDLLGRYHRHDLRDATVNNFMRRYQVDAAQARRVADTALQLLAPLLADEDDALRTAECRFLEWAALLHEIGLSVAHSSYHKHTAYILANADMPGFSRMDQGRLARIALAHRGKLERVQALDPHSHDWQLILCLRLAAILRRSRTARGELPVQLEHDKRGTFTIMLPPGWLQDAPLTAAALNDEVQQWARLDRVLRVKAPRAMRGED
ncbi:exopolyphosphatase [Uliginosibacterium sp. 31-16]|uniref:exopolyphosphatase n=1 Tax=Uliginosibacterium sp. 31-16 TaxID=3068315 RepID=UPI00273FC1A0|nr:exopolyphosphatase [Uliginosibacterium sp. 31-16]MDP5239436.1 exopolyphosphatase [Uliginosibacterium sp. 31-16]